jgi:hypothetical protein
LVLIVDDKSVVLDAFECDLIHSPDAVIHSARGVPDQCDQIAVALIRRTQKLFSSLCGDAHRASDFKIVTSLIASVVKTKHGSRYLSEISIRT